MPTSPLKIAATPLETMTPELTGRSFELPAPDAVQPGTGVFEAILYPNRSLPNAGFIAVMAIVVGVNLALGLFFTLKGAWPVLAFGGLDIFMVWLAFKLSYRQGRLHERIRVTPDEMLVSRVMPSGHEMRWTLQPTWTGVEIDDPIRHESQLQVHSKGKTLILGAFLSPKERLDFAKQLKRALAAKV